MPKITALSFIKVRKGNLRGVIDNIAKIPKVKEIFVLTGDYDIMVEINIDNPEELFDLWVGELEKIDGIIETNTHIVMKKVSL